MKEELVAMSVKDKWQTLTVMKFAMTGQKTVRIGEDDKKVATPSGKVPPPQSAKPLPPEPTSPFASARR